MESTRRPTLPDFRRAVRCGPGAVASAPGASCSTAIRSRWLTRTAVLAASPALGPVAFTHRTSAMEIPTAPLLHHWTDSTHTSYGVITAGLQSPRWKLEGSWFNGHEPNENRWAIDGLAFNSNSGRLSYAPHRNWVFQVSRGRLDNPEINYPEGHQGDVDRTTFSAIYNRPLRRGNWATTLAWGRNERDEGASDGVLIESNYNWADRNYLVESMASVWTARPSAIDSSGVDRYTLRMRPPSRRFAPRKTGDASPLGQLESAVMEVVWATSGPVQVGDVHVGLPTEARGAYATVKTTMERLAEKGILARSKEGKAYHYRAAVTREELERRIVTRTLDRLVEQFPDAVASFFVQPDPSVSQEKLTLLLEAVERRRETPDA